MTDPRIAVLSALSSPGWHPVPEAHGMPWDEAEQLLAAYDASRAAAVPSAPAGRAALLQRVTKAVQGVLPMSSSLACDVVADAVLAVLPEPADRAACPDPIECGHEAALGIAEMRLDQIRAKATEWSGLAPADDWGLTPQDTTLADTGRYLLRLLDLGPSRMADEAQQPEAGEPAQRNIQCADAFWLRQPHAAHDWQQRPDAQPVRCQGAGGAQQPETEPCGAWGGCTLARGHNIGQADIPENHRPPAVGAQQPKEA